MGAERAQLEIRRFRPGDYIRAGTRSGSMRLDVTLCLGKRRRLRRVGAADVFAEARSADMPDGLLEGPEGIMPQEPLLRAPHLENALHIVLKDSKTEHLVEPLGATAAGSRWDIAMDLEVEGGSSSEDGEE